MNVEFIWIYSALNDRLTQTVGRGNEYDITKTALRVHCKHDTGAPVSERTIR